MKSFGTDRAELENIWMQFIRVMQVVLGLLIVGAVVVHFVVKFW